MRPRAAAEQKAERFYLGYEEFQRLWKTAKENRRAMGADVDATQHAVIHSALYQGRIEERGLVLEARITATTRGLRRTTSPGSERSRA